MKNTFNNKINQAAENIIDYVNSIVNDNLFSGEWPKSYSKFDIFCYKSFIEPDVQFIKAMKSYTESMARIQASNIELTEDELLEENLYQEEQYEINGEVEVDEDELVAEILLSFDFLTAENAGRLQAELRETDHKNSELEAAVQHDLDLLRKPSNGEEEIDDETLKAVEHDLELIREKFKAEHKDRNECSEGDVLDVDSNGEEWDDDTDNPNDEDDVTADFDENSDDDDDEAVYDDDSDDDDDFDDDGGGTECRTCPMPVGSDEPKRLVDDIRRVHRRSQLYDSFSVAGVQYHEAAEAWSGLFVGAPVRIVRDRKNPFDSKAIALYSTPLSQTPDGSVSLNNLRTTAAVDGSFMLGFVPRYRNTGLAALLDNGYACRIHAEISELRWNPPMHRIDVNIYIDRDPEAEPEAPYIYDVLGEIEMKTLARELALTGSICFNYDIDDETEEFSMPNEGDTVYMINHSSQSGWTIYRLLITRMNLRQSRDHIEYIMANTYGPVRVPSSQFSWADDDEQLYLEPIHKAQKRLQAELEKLFGPADD